MQHILKKILDDDEKINKLMKDEGFVQEHVNGGILTITPKYKSFLLEFSPNKLDERRDLTRDEIAEHVKDTKLEVEDAIRILEQLKKDSYKLRQKFDTIGAQYRVLSHPNNPIFYYESVDKSCRVWYRKKYDATFDHTRTYEPGEDSEDSEEEVVNLAPVPEEILFHNLSGTDVKFITSSS